MIIMKNNHLNFVLPSKKIKKILKIYKVKRLALFGSYVKGRTHRHSDIDFLVEFKKDADLLDQAGLKIELQELLKRKVDVVTPNALSKYFRSQVMSEAVYL